MQTVATWKTELFWRQLIFGSDPDKTLLRVLAWTSLTVFTFRGLLLPITVQGTSMSPTYRDGAPNFINKLAYAAKTPKRGDVIALFISEEMLIKRIIGMPGETISIIEGHLEINGRPLVDRYSEHRVPCDLAPTRLREEEYFVIGDNREISVFGIIARHQIVGKAIF